MQVYAAPLAGGGRAVALFNRHNTEYHFNNMTVSWGMLGYDNGEKATVRDLFKRSDLGTHSGDIMCLAGVCNQNLTSQKRTTHAPGCQWDLRDYLWVRSTGSG